MHIVAAVGQIKTRTFSRNDNYSEVLLPAPAATAAPGARAPALVQRATMIIHCNVVNFVYNFATLPLPTLRASSTTSASSTSSTPGPAAQNPCSKLGICAGKITDCEPVENIHSLWSVYFRQKPYWQVLRQSPAAPAARPAPRPRTRAAVPRDPAATAAGAAAARPAVRPACVERDDSVRGLPLNCQRQHLVKLSPPSRQSAEHNITSVIT